jgi:lipopolysaccharide/colanic/teichoic acid biosynthesis glycosyltransferase
MDKEIRNYTYEELLRSTNGIYNKILKRIFDLLLALVLIIPLSPVYMILITLQFLTSGTPVFYRPFRGGYKNRPFRIFKFRTMVKNADKIGGGTTALNDPRITKFGNFLRKTKLDEIPQLFNIIKGNMSFIGPRPELLQYVEKYTDTEQFILKVRPGITDYSSIEFINLDEVVGTGDADRVYEEKILSLKNQLRLRYVNEISLITDMKIFIITVYRVILKILRVIRGK